MKLVYLADESNKLSEVTKSLQRETTITFTVRDNMLLLENKFLGKRT